MTSLTEAIEIMEGMLDAAEGLASGRIMQNPGSDEVILNSAGLENPYYTEIGRRAMEIRSESLGKYALAGSLACVLHPYQFWILLTRFDDRGRLIE